MKGSTLNKLAVRWHLYWYFQHKDAYNAIMEEARGIQNRDLRLAIERRSSWNSVKMDDAVKNLLKYVEPDTKFTVGNAKHHKTYLIDTKYTNDIKETVKLTNEGWSS